MPATNKTARTVMEALLTAVLLALWGCEGSATQTTNGGLIDGEMGGILVDRDGRPVADAKVQIWAAGAISPGVPGRPVNDPPEAVTDNGGRYKISDLAAGQYNLFGELGSGAAMVLIPAVTLGDSPLDLGVDTLKPPGKIIGKAITSEGPLEGAFCYLPGSSFISISDEDGSFALDRVPEGSYRLKYASAGYTTVTDTVVVTSGEVLALPARRLGPDISVQPPVPQGLRAEYDTVTGVITLSWEAVEVADLLDYILYTQEGGSEPVKQGSFGLDTVRVDSSYRLKFLPDWPWESRDTGSLVFLVKARDKDGNLSRRFSDPITLRMIRPQVYRGSFAVNPVGAGDSSACRDTVDLRIGFQGPVAGPFEGAVVVKRKLDPNFREEIYKEKLEPFHLGDKAAFTWYYGKDRGDPDFQARYPDRETFNGSTFEIKMTLVGPAEWAQSFTVDLETLEPGCFRPKPARME